MGGGSDLGQGGIGIGGTPGGRLGDADLQLVVERLVRLVDPRATASGISFGRCPGGGGGGGSSRVTVPLWQLSESTRTRTPAAHRLSSK
jgi:hypothetical protein